MINAAILNAGGVPFLTLKGHFVARPKQMPDGDTVAFFAGAPYPESPVRTNVPVGGAGSNTVNIRLQSIDAPEKSQPMGAASRDALLGHLGFDISGLGLSDVNFTVTGPIQTVPGWLATHGMDGNERPLGYLFRNDPGFRHGEIVPASSILKVIGASANLLQASKGLAFPAFYENTDESHAAVVARAAEKARSGGRGVWAKDRTTTGFIPTKKDLGTAGALVYPKFYRRVEKWMSAKADAKAFIRWIKSQADGKKLVQGAEASAVPLWKLFEAVGANKVRVPYDVSRLWFSE